MKIIKPGDANKPKPVIHRSKLFNGKRTAAEVHAQFGFVDRCGLCGGPPVIKVKMMALISEIKKRSPEYWVAICSAAAQGGHLDRNGNIMVPYIDTTYGKMIRFSQNTACAAHRRELEVTAAKAPSWVLVEIDRGPGADNPIVQVI